MDTKTKLQQARDLIDAAITELTSPIITPPDGGPVIRYAAEFEQAVNVSPPFSTLRFDPTFRYTRSVTLNKSLSLVSSRGGTQRITRDEPAPAFTAGFRAVADKVGLDGLEFRQIDPLTDIVVLSGRQPLIERCRILGDPVKGAKRGIAANGGDQVISRCYIADIFGVGMDTQAICAWDMEPGLRITDCYLEAAGQSVMLGGADSASEGRMPRAVVIRGCQLTKNPTWFVNGAQIKTALELKACVGVTVDDCVLEYAGTAQGQGAYLIVATVRNQNGKAPWSAIQNVTITNCRGAHAGGILNLLGQDSNFPSGALDGFTLSASSFTDIDPMGITGGSGRLFMFDRAPANVRIAAVGVQGKNLKALGYFSGPAPKKLTLTGLALPATTYGWKIDAGGQGLAALKGYMPDLVYDATV